MHVQVISSSRLTRRDHDHLIDFNMVYGGSLRIALIIPCLIALLSVPTNAQQTVLLNQADRLPPVCSLTSLHFPYTSLTTFLSAFLYYVLLPCHIPGLRACSGAVQLCNPENRLTVLVLQLSGNVLGFRVPAETGRVDVNITVIQPNGMNPNLILRCNPGSGNIPQQGNAVWSASEYT